MKIFETVEVQIGETIRLKNNVQSFKKNESVKITGFLGDDKTKILCKGILPGGWIDVNNLNLRPRLIKGLRFKTIRELICEYGINLYQAINVGFSRSYSLFDGRTLDDRHLVIESDKDGSIRYAVYTHPDTGVQMVFDEQLVTTAGPNNAPSQFTVVIKKIDEGNLDKDELKILKHIKQYEGADIKVLCALPKGDYISYFIDRDNISIETSFGMVLFPISYTEVKFSDGLIVPTVPHNPLARIRLIPIS